jgi:adenylate cyclase
MNPTDLQNVTDWLIDGARSATTPPAMMAQTCERLVEAGLPLWRVGVFVRTLHPDIFGVSFVWRQGAEVVVTQADFDIFDSDQYRSSPLSVLYTTEQEVRRRLSDRGDNSPFLADMREEGVTDYIAIPVRFTDGSMHASSWTTKRPGGFSEDHITGLRKLVSPLTRVIEIINLRRTAVNLLDTYVGNRAGGRILGGQIRRGHHDSMQAAIWLSDLRGFTALSDRLPAETVVEILNRYFDCQVAAIRAHGGEVLKFMGDGLLAVFPIAEADGNIHAVCSHMLEAARESRASVLDMQFAIGDVVERFRFGVALHVGKILFGNIGGGNRLDFTCIGPAVNLAARLEKIAGRLNRTIVASAEFAGICAGGWADLGEFPIAGFARTERVYGLADETPVS